MIYVRFCNPSHTTGSAGALRDAPGARPSRRRVSGSRAAAADGDSVCRGPVRQSGIRVEAVRWAVESRRVGTSDTKADRCPLWYGKLRTGVRFGIEGGGADVVQCAP